jgi:hypothetical protein
VDQPVRLRRHRLLQVALRVVPVGRVEHLAAEEFLAMKRDTPLRRISLGVPHPHDVQRAGVLRLVLERLHGVAAHLPANFTRSREPSACARRPSARASAKCPSPSLVFTAIAALA